MELDFTYPVCNSYYVFKLPAALKQRSRLHIPWLGFSVAISVILLITCFILSSRQNQLVEEIAALQFKENELNTNTASLSAELMTLQNEDTRKTNLELRRKIAEVETTFGKVSKVIELVSDARGQSVSVTNAEKELAHAINTLGNLDYAKAGEELTAVTTNLNSQIAKKQAEVAVAAQAAQDLPTAGSYRRQSVTTSRGTFTVSLIAESLSGVRMITDSANDDTCTKDCAALPLATYVSRNGGFAGINGSYFCPPDYPSCADKINSFNTLLFNARTKKYMNSDNNVYTSNPMIVHNADRSLRFMGSAQEWGRDTGIIGGISNYPMLVSGGNPATSESGAKGPRGFLGVKSGTIYIGVVHAADFGDAAATLATLGLETAMNLDGGGSSALYYNGKYVVGPGRNLPNAIILAR